MASVSFSKTRYPGIYARSDGGHRVVFRRKLRDGRDFHPPVVNRRDLTITEARQIVDRYTEAFRQAEANPTRRVSGIRARAVTVEQLYKYVTSEGRKWAGDSKHVKSYRRYYEKHVRPVLGDRQVDAVGQVDVEMLLEQIAATPVKRGGDHAPSKALLVYIYASVSRLFALGRYYQLTANNPTSSRMNWAALTSREELTEECDDAKPAKFLTDKERNALLSAAEGTAALPLLRLMDETGMRTGEALAILRKDVDTEGRNVTVRRSYQGGGEFVPTKTKRIRRFPCPQSLALFIEGLDRQPGDLIVCHPNGSALEPKELSILMAGIVKAAKLPKGTTAYALRHSFISRKLGEGANAVNVAKVTGHRVETLLAHYAHEDVAAIAKMMA